MTSELQTFLNTTLSEIRPPNYRSQVGSNVVAPNIAAIYHTSDDETELNRWMVSQHVRSWRLVSDMSVVVIYDDQLRVEMMDFARSFAEKISITPSMSRIIAGNIMTTSEAVRWMIKHPSESFINIWIPEFGEKPEEFMHFVNVAATIANQMHHELQLHFGCEPPEHDEE